MNPTKKNKLKSKYYALFNGKIDKEIIDAVLASSNYNGTYYVSLIVESSINLLSNSRTCNKLTLFRGF